MDTGISNAARAAERTPRLGEQPVPVHQPAAQPGRAPGVSTRLPQTDFLRASAIGMPPGADAALPRAGGSVNGAKDRGGAGGTVFFRFSTEPQLQPANKFVQWRMDLLRMSIDMLRCDGTISGFPWPSSVF